MEKEENDPMRPSKCRVEKADIFIVKEIQNVVSIQFRDQFFEHIGDLEKTALEIAQRFASYPPRSLKGLIRLLNYSRRDLDAYLRFENHEFISILEQTAFADRGAA